MLMIPDYFNFLLTGNKLQEYTTATTTQLVDPKANDWNWALVSVLNHISGDSLNLRNTSCENEFKKRKVDFHYGEATFTPPT